MIGRLLHVLCAETFLSLPVSPLYGYTQPSYFQLMSGKYIYENVFRAYGNPHPCVGLWWGLLYFIHWIVLIRTMLTHRNAGLGSWAYYAQFIIGFFESLVLWTFLRRNDNILKTRRTWMGRLGPFTIRSSGKAGLSAEGGSKYLVLYKGRSRSSTIRASTSPTPILPF